MEENVEEARKQFEDAIIKRYDALFKSKQHTDCSFLVGPQSNQKEFTAHKIILATASSAFDAMLYGRLADDNFPIAITDVDPDAFQLLLNYIYSGSIRITSFQEACNVCYAAKKYLFYDLVKHSIQLAVDKLDVPLHACEGFEFGKLFEVPVLMEKSWQAICDKTEDILSNSNIEEVDLSTLLSILDSDHLNVSSELVFFDAVHRWAIKECGRRCFPEDDSNLRSVAAPALEKIRFLSLTPQQFATFPALVPLLSRDEAFSILMRISNPKTELAMPNNFSTNTHARKRYDPPKCICENIIKTSKEITRLYNDYTGVVYFIVDKNICIWSLEIPTQTSEESSEYKENLTVHLYDSHNPISCMAIAQFVSTVEFNSSVKINFKDPIQIQRDKKYKISVRLGLTGFYPWGEGTGQFSIAANGVNFRLLATPKHQRPVKSIIFSY